MNHSILIAEDDPDTQFILTHALIDDGLIINVDFVSNGVELFNYLEPFKNTRIKSTKPVPKVILLDINMPYKDGKDTLLDLKNDAKLKDIPVAMMTSSFSKNEKDFYYNLGVVHCYDKPTFLEEYVLMIQNIKKRFLNLNDRLTSPPIQPLI